MNIFLLIVLTTIIIINLPNVKKSIILLFVCEHLPIWPLRRLCKRFLSRAVGLDFWQGPVVNTDMWQVHILYTYHANCGWYTCHGHRACLAIETSMIANLVMNLNSVSNLYAIASPLLVQTYWVFYMFTCTKILIHTYWIRHKTNSMTTTFTRVQIWTITFFRGSNQRRFF